MKITITKRQEYVNDEAKEPMYEIEVKKQVWGCYDWWHISKEGIKKLRDELNKLKI